MNKDRDEENPFYALDSTNVRIPSPSFHEYLQKWGGSDESDDEENDIKSVESFETNYLNVNKSTGMISGNVFSKKDLRIDQLNLDEKNNPMLKLIYGAAYVEGKSSEINETENINNKALPIHIENKLPLEENDLQSFRYQRSSHPKPITVSIEKEKVLLENGLEDIHLGMSTYQKTENLQDEDESISVVVSLPDINLEEFDTKLEHQSSMMISPPLEKSIQHEVESRTVIDLTKYGDIRELDESSIDEIEEDHADVLKESDENSVEEAQYEEIKKIVDSSFESTRPRDILENTENDACITSNEQFHRLYETVNVKHTTSLSDRDERVEDRNVEEFTPSQLKRMPSFSGELASELDDFSVDEIDGDFSESWTMNNANKIEEIQNEENGQKIKVARRSAWA